MYQDWKSLIFHEQAHILNKDSAYFTFTALTGNILAAQLLGLVGLGFLIPQIEPGFEQVANGTAVLYGLTAAFAVTGLLFTFWIWRSLHRREFNADAYAASRSAGSFRAWLERAVRRSRLAPVSKWSSFKSAPARIWGSFTHPTPIARLGAVDGVAPQARWKIAGDVGFSIYLFMTFALIALVLLGQAQGAFEPALPVGINIVIGVVWFLIMGALNLIKLSYISCRQYRHLLIYEAASFLFAFSSFWLIVFSLAHVGFDDMRQLTTDFFAVSRPLVTLYVLTVAIMVAANALIYARLGSRSFNILICLVVPPASYIVSLVSHQQFHVFYRATFS